MTTNLEEKRRTVRAGMIQALDEYLNGKVDDVEYKRIIDDYEMLAEIDRKGDVDATAYDNYEVL